MENEPVNNVPASVQKGADPTKAFVPYEEVQEKKTTKLGYILLIIMVLLGVTQGQGFIQALSDNVPSPQSISSCGSYLKGLVNADTSRGGYYYGNISSNCSYSSLEIKYSIPNIVNEIYPIDQKVEVAQKELQNLNSASWKAQDIITREKQNYNISLQEKIAQETGTVYDGSQVKSSLSIAEAQYASFQSQISIKNSEIAGLNNSISVIANKNATAINNVFIEYTGQVKLVEFERALLLLVLISPLLYFSTKKYFKHKRGNSQYTIIWAAITTIFALLFAQVLFTFIYRILPYELITKLLKFFAQFGFLVTIGQYALLLLAPAIFGGIVYWIQKKVYNKEAVARRSLKSHKCPSCQMLLRESDRFCPVCDYQIKEKCDSCGADRILGLAFCPSCGGRKS